MKKIKLILVFTLFITLFPMQVYADVEKNEINSIVEDRIEEYAKSINKSNADSSAAAALATHGLTGRGKTLNVGSSHALTATLLNSKYMQATLVGSITKSIDFMHKIDLDEFICYSGLYYYEDPGSYITNFYKTTEKNTDYEYYDFQIFVGSAPKANSYDKSLFWMVAYCDVFVTINRVKINNKNTTYRITVEISDRFDFSTSSNDGFKNLISGIGAKLFKEFDWKSTVSFDIDIPNDGCNHEYNNYQFTYDSIKNIMNSNSNKVTQHSFLNTSANAMRYYYELDEAIVLYANKPWVLEYDVKGKGNFELSLLPYSKSVIYPALQHRGSKSNTIQYYERLKVSQSIMNQHNLSKNEQTAVNSYGTKLNDDLYDENITYTFKYENIIDKKGNNMIYLTILNAMTGEILENKIPMNDYYRTESWSTEKMISTESNYLNGKDFYFKYIGNEYYPLTFKTFELRVWENGKNEQCDSFNDKVVTTSTCTTEGSMKRTCERCGYSYTTSIKALGHSFSNYVDNGNGTSTSKCDHCNETDTRIDILLGDVNSDGTVTALDRTILARYIAQWSGYDTINEINADVNGDGKVTALDRTILARHLARWQGYEELPYIK